MLVVRFAMIASAICVLVGPLFVPFFIVPTLEWLSWGWLKYPRRSRSRDRGAGRDCHLDELEESLQGDGGLREGLRRPRRPTGEAALVNPLGLNSLKKSVTPPCAAHPSAECVAPGESVRRTPAR
jgi:hypothetical protein